MKLYTENQVRNALKDAMLRGMRKPSKYEYIVESMMDDLTPIELPSDEDEEKAAFTLTKNLQQHMGFNIGAKWMRDKIGGNNEQQ